MYEFLAELDRQQLPVFGISAFEQPELKALSRRRSPPTLWFSRRHLPPLYDVHRVARCDDAVVDLVLRVLMYCTSHDQHSGLGSLGAYIARESLERFALALLEQWWNGPQNSRTDWALWAQRDIGGLQSFEFMFDVLLENVDELLERVSPNRVNRSWMIIDVFFDEELFGPSFLGLLERHPDERIAVLLADSRKQAGERTRARSMDSVYVQSMFERLHGVLQGLGMAQGTRQIELEHTGQTLTLRLNEFGGLDVAFGGRQGSLFSTEELFTIKVCREVWLLLELFDQIAESWQVLMERAHEDRHHWSQRSWRSTFFSDHVTSQWSRGIIWAEFREQEYVGSFRIAEDDSLADVHDEVYELCEGSMICVAHTEQMAGAEVTRWGDLLADYEIVSMVTQFVESPCDGWSKDELLDFLREGVKRRRAPVEMLRSYGWRRMAMNPGYYGYSGGIRWRRRVMIEGHRWFIALTHRSGSEREIESVKVFAHARDIQGTSPYNIQLLDREVLEILVGHVMQVVE